MPAPVASDGLQLWAVQFPSDQPGSFSSKFPPSLNCLTLSHLGLVAPNLWGGQGVPVVIKVDLHKWVP